MPTQSRPPAFFWLVVCTVPLYAALWLFSGHVLVRDFHHSKAYGWTLAARDTGWVVATVDENGPAAGRLEVGDRLLALNGDTRVAVLGSLFFANARVGLVDERADIFAVGVMVVETLTGTRPFGGATQQEILLALLQGEYHLPGDSAETRLLDAIVQRCLAKDPRDRYGSVADVAKDLVPALGRSVGFGAHRASTISESPTLGDWNSPI